MSLIDALNKLPSVDRLLAEDAIVRAQAIHGRDVVVAAIRQGLDQARDQIRAGGSLQTDDLIRLIEGQIQLQVRPTLKPAINATGVVLHTNLGRAPLGHDVLRAMQEVGSGYSNLEFELEPGVRGSRYTHAEDLLRRLTGAEAALVVNNNAGAVVLMLSALAQGREVVLSRGQLVEIGGGFRIPDVMAQSGAHLVEVGTTNRTYARDYEAVIGEQTAALLRVHSSNFRVIGFTATPGLDELVELAHSRDLLMLDDLGSGTLLDTAPYGLEHEPTIQESVNQGADIVTFSGDKLLGGPQAGYLVGKADLIAQLRRHPLTRALRVDKTTLAGIQANLLHYVKGEAAERVPIWHMISMSSDTLERRARALVDDLGHAGSGCQVIPGRSMIGGGSLPEESLATWLIALPGDNAASLAHALRVGKPAVVPRIQEGRVLLDLRTVLEHQREPLILRLRELLGD